jgi:protein gp37
MNDTGISWATNTWNVFSGCERVGPGCAECYAFALAEKYRGTAAFPNGFELTIRRHKLTEPLKLKKPALIFTNSMSDFFWDQVPDTLRDEILDVMRSTPQHQYQILTKRPAAMVTFFQARKVPDNVWLGVTIESQEFVDRLDLLRQVDASVRFVSAEPILSELATDWAGIHWVIGGGESGTHLSSDESKRERRGLVQRDPKTKRWVPRADRLPWARRLRDDVKKAGGAFYWKQFGGPRPDSAGRELDGRVWDEFPRLPATGVWRPEHQPSLPVVK